MGQRGIVGVCAVVVVLFRLCIAADWPCYQADAGRSGGTRENLVFPLDRMWTYEPSQRPRPAWPEPGREMHRVDFDYAFQPVAAGGLVYFSSSTDDTIRAVNVVTGRTEWRFTTDGPLRFAPHLADGNCYVAGDDGFVYCLKAATGKLVWKFRAAPGDDQVIGNERMISRWPCRTGVLVVDGVVYTTAGMWPSEGIFVYALDARKGKLIWRNDTSGCMYLAYPHGGAYALGGVAPQGYLLASEDVLLVPTGRSVPAGFDRHTGRFLYYHAAANKQNGGAWATIVDDLFFNARHGGAPDTHIQRGESPARPGDRMGGYSVATGAGVLEVPNKHCVLAGDEMLYGAGGGEVQAIDLKTLREKKQPDAIAWAVPHGRVYCMARAGDTLLLGGQNVLAALRADDGQPIWRRQVRGQVRGLAIADGRLIVATNEGTIYCFAGRGTTPVAGTERSEPARPTEELDEAEHAAEVVKVIRQSNITKGYALVLGQRDARLAEYLAEHTALHVINPLSSRSKVDSERERLVDARDLCGSRVAVHQLDGYRGLPYGPYFANVVVVSGKARKIPGPELYRVLRPCGGVLCFVDVRRSHAAKLIAQANIPQDEIREAGDSFVVVRGGLPGAFDWDSETTSDLRVRWPLELLWFGGPGPDRMVPRHWRAHTPIAANGRYFVPADYHLIAVDAYNGCELWSRELGLVHSAKMPVSADDDSVYVNFPELCLELDAQTGVTKKIYGEPKPSERFSLAQPQTIELEIDDAHSGTVSMKNTKAALEITLTTKDPAVTDTDSWTLYFDFRPSAKRTLAYGPGAFQLSVVPALANEKGIPLCQPGLGPVHPRLILTSKEAEGGSHVVLRLRWDRIGQLTGEAPTDFAFGVAMTSFDGAKNTLAKAYKFVDATGINNGWAVFTLGPAKKGASAKPSPVPRADLADLPEYAREWGRMPQRETDATLATRTQPLTAKTGSRAYRRAYGCCGVASSATMDFFRSGTIGFYDLAGDGGMRNFAGVKPGCGMTIIPALGVVIASEGSAACTCSYNFQTSVALVPTTKRTNEDWAVFHDSLEESPLQRAALNLGAPGDRRDRAGALWLGMPRPQSGMGVSAGRRVDLHVPMSFIVEEGFGPHRVNSDHVEIKGTQRPWLYASCLRGLKSAVIDLECMGVGLAALPLETEPNVDGRLAEPFWSDGAAISVSEGKAFVFLRHDDENLYAAYKRPATIDRRGVSAPWKTAIEDADGPVWEDDSFELYFSDKQGDKCLHLGVSASGARYDAAWTYVNPYPEFIDIPRLEDISIDGSPDDWQERGYVAESLVSQQGFMRLPKDFDPSFRLGWNDRGLLVLVKVRDDEPLEDERPAYLWAGDSIEAFMSPQQGSKGCYQVAISTGADPRFAETRTHFYDNRRGVATGNLSVEVVSKKVEGGYVAEALLPWKNVGVDPAVGREIGFQIFVNDVDEGRPHFRAIWHPMGHLFWNANACHRVRLSLKPSEPMRFVRGKEVDEHGQVPAVPPYPWPPVDKGLGKHGEDPKWGGAWASGVRADAEAFTAEVAVPWTTLESAAMAKGQLTINVGGHGELAGRPRRGFGSLVLRAGKTKPPQPFTVRLHFAELDDVKRGERVFDVKLQGRVVLEDFDVVKAARGGNRAVVREFTIVTLPTAMTLELIPKVATLTERTAPIVSGIEVIAGVAE